MLLLTISLALSVSGLEASGDAPGFRLPSDVRPLDYTIDLDLDPKKATFDGNALIKVRLSKARSEIVLHGRGLEVKRASVDGKRATWKQLDDDGLATLTIDRPVGPGDVRITIQWTAKYNPSLEGAYKVEHAGESYVFTQFEAVNARDAFPCFDEPGFKAPFLIGISTPKGNVAVANTPVRHSKEESGKVNTLFEVTAPLPTYLVAFAVGPLDVVDGPVLPKNVYRDRPLPLRGIAPKGQGARLKMSLDVSAEILTAAEKWFGVAYPYQKLDIVAVPDFAAGAMENVGLVTFRDSLLYVDATSPIGLQKGNAYVIAHELAHQWFGNLVTPVWWDDLWLNEAFASWMENILVQEVRPQFLPMTDARAGTDWVSGADSLVSARQIRQPVLSKGDILNAFDGITYTKGASVISMFEHWLGERTFQQGVRAYLAQHRHGNATAKDLLDALSRNARRDVTTSFSTFLDQPGVPFFEVKGVACNAGKATLSWAQSRFLPIGSTGDRNKRWSFPVCVKMFDGKHWTKQCSLVDGAAGDILLDACPKVLHPNVDGAGYYRFSLPAEQLKALTAELKMLSDGERISLQNAIRAGFAAGTLPFADALTAGEVFARDVEPVVMNMPLGLLSLAKDEYVDPRARPSVQKKIAQLYRPVLDEVGPLPKPSDDPRTRERRTFSWNALVVAAEDAKATADLAKMGRAYFGIDGDKKIHPEAVPADLAALAAFALVRTGGVAVFDELDTRLSTETDSMVRGYILRALGSALDPVLAARAINLALDPRVKINETWAPMGAQFRDPRTRDAAWQWFTKNFDALAKRLPEASVEGAPGAASGFCSDEKAKEVEAFFRPKLDQHDGMKRSLAQALENIRLCVAKKNAQQESARKMFPR